jgi:hypothetical protein
MAEILERLRARWHQQYPVVRSQLIVARDRLVLPLTPESMFYHYLPLQGLVTYSVLSLNVMTPRLCGSIYAK